MFSLQNPATSVVGSSQANDLAAGQTQSFEIFQYVPDDKYDAMQAASFNIVEASMY